MDPCHILSRGSLSSFSFFFSLSHLGEWIGFSLWWLLWRKDSNSAVTFLDDWNSIASNVSLLERWTSTTLLPLYSSAAFGLFWASPKLYLLLPLIPSFIWPCNISFQIWLYISGFLLFPGPISGPMSYEHNIEKPLFPFLHHLCM